MSPRAAWRLESLGFSRVLDYVDGKLDWFARGMPREGEPADPPHADAVVRRDVPTCRLGDRLGVVRERARAAGWERCVVVNEERVVLGLLGGSHWDGEGDQDVEAVMESGPATFRPHLELQEVVDYLRKHRLDGALITTSDGKLVGSLDRAEAERRVGQSAAQTGAAKRP